MAVKPQRLKKGSNIGIVAPAGPGYDTDRIYRGIQAIRDNGFNIVPGRTVFAREGYFSADDNIRAEDINCFFKRKDIDGIICLRGGYGAQRILDKIDYSNIKNNPKVFIGYSDITSIHIAIIKFCHMVTFHGPMVYPDFGGDIDEYTLSSLIRNITVPEPIGQLKNPEGYGDIEILSPGYAEGEIVGGNLSLIASCIGTPYELDMDGKILFLEDIGEEPYRIDRMLTQLILSGGIKKCSAILLGQWTDCTPKKPDCSFSLMEVLKDRLMPLGIPVLYNIAAGHDKTKMTLPLGVRCRVTKDGKIQVLENGVAG